MREGAAVPPLAVGMKQIVSKEVLCFLVDVPRTQEKVSSGA